MERWGTTRDVGAIDALEGSLEGDLAGLDVNGDDAPAAGAIIVDDCDERSERWHPLRILWIDQRDIKGPSQHNYATSQRIRNRRMGEVDLFMAKLLLMSRTTKRQPEVVQLAKR